MRPAARLALGIGALLGSGIGLPRAEAQAYSPGRPMYYVQQPTYTYAPQPRVVAPAPTYYAQPRAYYVQPQPAPAATYYAAPARPRGLFRVRKYRDSSAYPYVLVDPNNRHWTFDYNQWMAHNF